jgi:hypothetical protein
MLTLGLMLAACGGGGVNSTPTPTPGTTTPTPGTPTPTPSSGTNDDLLPTLVSETFANTATHGTATFPKNGDNGTSSTSSGAVTFSYNAANNSYTVSTLGRSQTFAAGDVDASGTNALITTYLKTSGNRSDSLVLTKPGTSGPLTYRYVGAGFWQRTDETSNSISGSFDAFVYGVPTSNAAMVRTGGARYAVDLLGVYAPSNNLLSLAGDGELNVDFETGKLTTMGNYESVYGDGTSGAPGSWTGTGTLTSGTNKFTGTTDFYPVGNTAWSGQFFGPDAEEVGAVISGSSIFGTVVATMTGRRSGTLDSTSTGIENISRDVSFSVMAGTAAYTRDAANHKLMQYTTSVNGGLSGASAVISYKTGGRYEFAALAPDTPYQAFDADDISSALSNSKFVTYEIVGSNRRDLLQIYRPGSANSELALSYTGFAHYLNELNPGLDDRYGTTEVWAVYYISSGEGSAAPTTGSATYNGRLYGIALPVTQGAAIGDMTGSFTLQANFGTSTFLGTMVPVIALRGGGSVSPGTFTFSGLDSAISGPGVTYSNFYGQFTGPHSEEVGGSFIIQTDAYNMTGAVAGKRN